MLSRVILNGEDMVTYQIEDYLENLPGINRLIEEHYDELCVTKDFPLEPNYEAYERTYNSDLIRFISCKDDGVMVGYILFIISPHLHYKSCLTAFEDLYFLRKEYRQGRTGIRLFQFAEKVLKEQGINRIIYHTKVHSDNSKLFEYLNYKFTDKVFTKLL